MTEAQIQIKHLLGDTFLLMEGIGKAIKPYINSPDTFLIGYIMGFFKHKTEYSYDDAKTLLLSIKVYLKYFP